MRSRLATVLAAAALLSGLTACEAVTNATSAASNATDKAGICVEALKLANFTPSAQNVEKTAEDAKRTADDLTALAEKSPDAALREALNDMSDKVSELTVPNLDPTSITSWAKNKVDAVNTLSQACL
ncbi:bacteriophage spanin2 family protein [Actinokineospora sp. NBRC 105648]|uniref:bacteriophage spanin2 family protein n=1 Tax=Actinokineospora sp. NBRC 105648 TaxID=3032206 RepID=UPI0024A55F0B|nr:bacteriophage spanin2 family protein [Actinokineospora sp. NBRC 105648]GLZ43285.1 hypothetical protein Acsp05_69090 [Actinokineospora sp. NBRC 105648]